MHLGDGPYRPRYPCTFYLCRCPKSRLLETLRQIRYLCAINATTAISRHQHQHCSQALQTWPASIFFDHPKEKVISHLGWLPALKHVRMEVGICRRLIQKTIKMVLRTSSGVRSILIQPDPSVGKCNQDQMNAWSAEDARIKVEKVKRGYNEWQEWEDRIVSNARPW